MSSTVSGLATTFNLPNFVGELFFLTPVDNTFTSMIGGLTGGQRVQSIDFPIGQFADNVAASQPDIAQGADATFSERDRTQTTNVVQIHQEGFHLAYTKLAAVDNVSAANLSVLGTQPVQDERAFQARLKFEKLARDIEFSYLQGTYANPGTNASGRKTRGLKNAITTNAVAASAAALTTTHVDTLLRTMWNNAAPFRMVVVFCNAFQKQAITKLYGYAPMSRNVGGLNINLIETDFAMLGIVLDRHMPTDEIYFVEVSVCSPKILEIPGYGFLFMEQLAKTGSAEKYQIYGEVGLNYGPESWHGKITGLATS